MATKLYAYRMGSESARLLCDAMDIVQLKHEGSRYRPRTSDVLINWGAHSIPSRLRDLHVINDPVHTQVVADKMLYANRIIEMQQHEEEPHWFRSIGFTTQNSVAYAWQRAGHTVVARTITNGSEGAGIRIIKPTDPMVHAPLYSLYQPKEREYRVNVVNGQVIKVQRKLRSRSLPPPVDGTFYVRNTANGFLFNTVTEYPTDVATQAINACAHFNLDFGGVDVIYKEARLAADGRAYVVEINSAPGIEGSTVTAYAEALTALANSFSRS